MQGQRSPAPDEELPAAQDGHASQRLQVEAPEEHEQQCPHQVDRQHLAPRALLAKQTIHDGVLDERERQPQPHDAGQIPRNAVQREQPATPRPSVQHEHLKDGAEIVHPAVLVSKQIEDDLRGDLEPKVQQKHRVYLPHSRHQEVTLRLPAGEIRLLMPVHDHKPAHHEEEAHNVITNRAHLESGWPARFKTVVPDHPVLGEHAHGVDAVERARLGHLLLAGFF